jgi:hypothetical protein
MLNVRIDKDTEKRLEKYAQQHDLSKSQVVKEALAIYLSKTSIDSSAFDLGKDLFGQEGSRKQDLSSTYKKQVKEKLREKYTH